MSSKKLTYYPLFLNIVGKTCIVVGGGRVAERKVRSLLACGARVRVVSPLVCKNIRELYEKKRVELLERDYTSGDLRNAALVFAATDDVETNKRVSREARKKQIAVNVADSPELCDFIVPAMVKQGPVVIAISTSGTLPMLARMLRKEIERQLSKDLASYTEKVGRLRKLLIEQVEDPSKRELILKKISRVSISEIAAMSMKELRDRFFPVVSSERNSRSARFSG